MSRSNSEWPRAPQCVIELDVPVLGICYGMQTMARQVGGAVEASTHREFGFAQVRARGVAASVTVSGPPERITPFGLKARIAASLMSNGCSSQYTPASRTRRAMSWVYLDPLARIWMRC